MKQVKNVTLEERWQKVVVWAALCTPLIVLTSQAIFPFIFPKAIYFEVVSALLLITLVPTIATGAWRPMAKKGFFWLLLLYLAALVASAYTAFDVNRAWWSNFERMTGAVYIIHAILFGLCISIFFGERDEHETVSILRVMLWISALVSLTGIIQVFDPSFLNSMSNRVAGVFGNPIYLGGFAAESLLFVGYLLFARWHTSMRYELMVIGVLNVFALYFSGTRSALLALLIGIVVLSAAFAPRLWTRGYQRHIIVTFSTLLVFGVLMLVGVRVGFFGTDSMLNRLLDFSSQTSTASTRFIAWEIAWKGFKERPLLGWGPENYFYVFNKFFNPRSQLFGNYETWFDHAHNAPLEVLVSQGVIGFVLYIAQYIVLLWMAIRLFIKQDGVRQVYIGVLGTFFVVHFVHNLFVFDHPASYMFFYFVAGLLFAEYIREGAPTVRTVSTAIPMSYVRGVQVLVFASMLWVVVPSVRQNYTDLRAQITLSQGDAAGAQAIFEDAVAMRAPHTGDVLLDIGRTLQSIPLDQIVAQKNYVNFGIQSLQKLLRSYEPANVLAAILQGQLLTNVAALTHDASAAELADRTFHIAAQYSPDRQQVYYSWARLKFVTNDRDAGSSLMEHAIQLEPRVAISHWYFATMLMGNDAKRAAQELQTALDLGYAFSGPDQIRAAAQMFAEAGNYQAAVGQEKTLIQQGYITRSDDPLLKELDEYAASGRDLATRQWLREQFPGNALPPLK